MQIEIHTHWYHFLLSIILIGIGDTQEMNEDSIGTWERYSTRHDTGDGCWMTSAPEWCLWGKQTFSLEWLFWMIVFSNDDSWMIIVTAYDWYISIIIVITWVTKKEKKKRKRSEKVCQTRAIFTLHITIRKQSINQTNKQYNNFNFMPQYGNQVLSNVCLWPKLH